jgi:hypothetical protein
MSATLTEAELEVIWAAAAALPPPQRALFQERVAAELKSLPCGMLGPGTLYRASPRPRRSSAPAACSPSARAPSTASLAKQASRD